MAAKILEQLDETATLTPGHAGEFTVWLDGKEIIRKTTQLFPEPHEVIAAIDRARSG